MSGVSNAHSLSVVVSLIALKSTKSQPLKINCLNLVHTHELAAQFKTIGGAAFGFMFPVLQGEAAHENEPLRLVVTV